MSVEQAIGRLLIWGQLQHEELLACQRQLEEQEEYIADLFAQVVEKDGTDVGDNPNE